MKTKELKRAAALQQELEAVEEMMADLEQRQGDEVMSLCVSVRSGPEEGTVYGDVPIRVMDVAVMLHLRRRAIVKKMRELGVRP